MGKSPGKWIKTLLFGKKTSKANFSKGRQKGGKEKDVWVSAKAPEADLALDPPVASDLAPNIIATNKNKLEENRETASLPLESGMLVPEDIYPDTQVMPQLDAPKDPESTRREQAATKVQAALRGFLARRAFLALKGIIRLQALFRGHLVRRQAVSTLHCMLGIVKLQALARGKNVRCSAVGLQVQKKCILIKPLESELVESNELSTSEKVAKLSANAVFVRKLLASSPSAMPLCLQYNSTHTNSVINWLERWSVSPFWKPIPLPKKFPGSKSQKKQGNLQTVDTETGRVKQSMRRNLPSNLDNVSVQSSSESERPRCNLRKGSSYPSDSVQEHPQNELEKVKRSLRKVQKPIMEGTIVSDLDGAKPKFGPGKMMSSSGKITAEESISSAAEKMKQETSVSITKQPDIEATVEPLVVNKTIDFPHNDQTALDSQTLESNGKDASIPVKIDENAETIPAENDEKAQGIPAENNGKYESIPAENGELSFREDVTANESQKSASKGSSSVKQESLENGLQNRPTLPSYMAVTESAKAKLRAQGSPRFGQDEVEKQNLTRRHSLPASTNSKTSSPSPRAQKPVQTSGKGGNRSDRSLLSSRDGNVKGVQAEWRR